MPTKKIVCLGAGSTYFPRALGDLAINQGLAGSEIALYDIDFEKSQIMARLGQRLAKESGTGLKVRACKRRAEALDGADFAISSIGGAGPTLGRVYGSAVHRADIAIPAKYGIYQIIGDTGGPAGMMMALRSIPIYLELCEEMAKRCPNVILFNHSNPMAVLCRAMIKHSPIKNVIGICHGVQGGIMRIAQLLKVEPEELDVTWIGTNHFHWFMRIRLHGQDVYERVMKLTQSAAAHPHEEMSWKLAEAYGYCLTYPDDSHTVEFYPYLAQAKGFKHLPYALKDQAKEFHKAEDVAQPANAKEAAEYRAQALADLEERLSHRDLPPPEVSFIRGEGIATLLEGIATGARQVRILNLPNEGIVPNLPDYAILEAEAVTDSCGARGVYVGEAPMVLKGLLEKRIAWQELVADAAATGDRRLAVQALMTDEMAIRPELSQQMLDELLEASKDYLPQFKFK